MGLSATREEPGRRSGSEILKASRPRDGRRAEQVGPTVPDRPTGRGPRESATPRIFHAPDERELNARVATTRLLGRSFPEVVDILRDRARPDLARHTAPALSRTIVAKGRDRDRSGRGPQPLLQHPRHGGRARGGRPTRRPCRLRAADPAVRGHHQPVQRRGQPRGRRGSADHDAQ